jgi:hypothetical protein
MSHWLDYYLLLVINSFVIMILIIPKLVRRIAVVTNIRLCFPWGPPRGYIAGSFKGAVSCQNLREFN